MGLGYSVSNATSVFPGIRYTGRLAADPLGTMPQGEAVLIAGSGSQTGGGNRWGDYSAMSVDPVDDCTFWYTNEYHPATTPADWKTRIGSFKFPDCTPGPPIPIVAVTKVSDAVEVSAGSQIGFTVTLSNSGAATATGLNVTDNLPSGGSVDWSIDGANSDPGWFVSGSPPNESLVYSPTTLAAGTTTKAHVVSATAMASCGVYQNRVSFTTNNGGSGQKTAATTVDDCTFWYINEDYNSDPAEWVDGIWRTRIGSFKFANCTVPTAVKVRSFAARRHGKSITVTWRTASETDAVGFHVFRSVGTGPFRKVNRTLIAAKRSGAATGAVYRFVDRVVKGRQTYTYRLQTVSANGRRTWHTIGSAAA
jgi:uncharacterized repeat protein (TIGR01451 family)